MPPAGHVFLALFSGGITFGTTGGNVRQPEMLALVRRPSLHGNYACMVYWTEGALRRICRQKYGETSFSPFRVFLFSRNSRERFWGLVFWHLWIGRARHPGPSSTSPHLGIEVLNVGGWLTHGDLALDTSVDFLAVVEHCLIRFGVNGLVLKGRIWLLFGPRLRGFLLMLVVLALVLLV